MTSPSSPIPATKPHVDVIAHLAPQPLTAANVTLFSLTSLPSPPPTKLLYKRSSHKPPPTTISMRPTIENQQPHMQPAAFPSSPSSSSSSGAGVKTAVEETPVVVIGRRGCCMGHVVKHLLRALGVSPTVWEIAGEEEEAALMVEIGEMGPTGYDARGFEVTLPVVFIGGRLLGGLDQLMAAHISGELVPNLKEAGALWL